MPYASIILVLLVGGGALVLGTQEFGYIKEGVDVRDLPHSWQVHNAVANSGSKLRILFW